MTLVALVALSEFGRRVVESDSFGTDHGDGNVMFVAGAGPLQQRRVRPDRHHRLPPVFPGPSYARTGVML